VGPGKLSPENRPPPFLTFDLWKQAGVTGGKTVNKGCSPVLARLVHYVHTVLVNRRLMVNCEQYGVVWRMMEASLDVVSSDGSVAGCERVLDVSVLGCRWGGGGERW